MKPQAPVGKPASLSAQELASALWDNIFGSGADSRRMRNFNQTVTAAEGGDRSAEARIVRNPDGTPRSALPSFTPDVGGIGMIGRLGVKPSISSAIPRRMYPMTTGQLSRYIENLEAAIPKAVKSVDKKKLLDEKSQALKLFWDRLEKPPRTGGRR